MAKSVLTITLNPTVDKSCEADGIKPDKKIRCSQPKYEPGGGGINVSRGLERLGIKSLALFTSGGRTGELLEKLLQKENVDCRPVPVAAETRENFIVVDTTRNDQFRFGMPGEDITKQEAEAIHREILGITPLPEIAVI